MMLAHYLIQWFCFVYAWGIGPYGVSSYWLLQWFMVRWPARFFFWLFFFRLGFTAYFLVFHVYCPHHLRLVKAAGLNECVDIKSMKWKKRKEKKKLLIVALFQLAYSPSGGKQHYDVSYFFIESDFLFKRIRILLFSFSLNVVSMLLLLKYQAQ